MIETRGRLGLLLCASLFLPGFALAKDAELGGYDVLSRPGHTVTLKAKLETTGFMGVNPDVEEEPLDFFLVSVDGKLLERPKFLGTGETNDDGVATLEWKPSDPGQYELEARVRKGSEYVALPAEILVAVPAKDRAIILVQIDKTVSTATNLKMFRGVENDKIAAVEGAPETLATLSKHYQLVYLTDLERSFTEKFKGWLSLRKIPPAPVIFWDLFERSLSHETYMKKLVAKPHQDFSQASIGIGGHEDDGAAYVASGLSAIVITDDPSDLPQEVVPARRWGNVLKHIVAIYRAKSLMEELAGSDRAKRGKALEELTLYGRAGVGYVNPFRRSTDPNVASAATLVVGKLQACEAFYESLHLTSANDALHSLLAAWKYGERAVVQRIYKEPEAAKSDSIPSFDSCELVSRHEPEPAKVVFKITLKGEGEPVEKTLVFQRQEDKTWRLYVEEF